MHEEQLTRIAEALEAINENLNVINSSLSDASVSLSGIDSNLEDCISRYNGNSFLCITGNISTT